MRLSRLAVLAALALPAPLDGQRPPKPIPAVPVLPDFPAPVTSSMAAIRSAMAASKASMTYGLAQLAPALARARYGLAAAATSLVMLGAESAPPAPWAEQDPADSLYRRARSALNRSSYAEAAYLFAEISARYPKSSYTPDAYYWEAFARYRRGGNESLNTALAALKQQQQLFPSAATRRDAEGLAARIQGQLARLGDRVAAEEVARMAEQAARTEERGTRVQERRLRELERRARTQARERCQDDDDDMRTAALNALLQMDAEKALPILKKVLARRDSGSVCLRRKAVFLVSQHEGAETETILLNAARTDPDPEVKGQAVFWLSQVDSEHAVAALDSILRSATDTELQEKAVFALSQHDSPRAQQALRDFALKRNVPSELREKAIFWIGQSDSGENAPFLRNLYKTLKELDLKEKILFSVSQVEGKENQRWLLEIAGDASEDVELRKKALFWVGQSDISLPELFGLYDRMTDREMREHLIFVYSQRDEKAAVDKLIQIAKTEKDKELRKKALFWLTQSDDPRVPDILAEILEKP